MAGTEGRSESPRRLQLRDSHGLAPCSEMLKPTCSLAEWPAASSGAVWESLSKGLTGLPVLFMLERFPFCVPKGRDGGIGKLVRIQHGPATVIGDESRNDGHCPLGGWEGRGK